MKPFLNLILVVILIFVGCSDEGEEFDKIDDRIVVFLIENDDPEFFDKTIYLYDGERYTIKTILDTFINEYPFTTSWEYEDEIKPRILADAEQTDSLNLMNYTLFVDDSIYIVAHYLETGKCLILDKMSKAVLKQLKYETYVIGDSLEEGYGGRRFYLYNNLFWQTVDWKSK